MANGGRIDFTIGYKVDKTGLNDLKSSLTAVGKLMPSDLVNLNIYSGSAKEQMNQARSDFMKMKLTLSQVEEAFNNAFDSTTGITNLQKLNQSLNNIGVEKLAQQFNKFGEVGQNAFYQITRASLTTKMQLKENVSLLDKMGQTLMNTLRWSISSSIINKFTGAVQQAYGYVQHLDTSLNDIRIVTGKSADEMDRFAEKANNAAKALGASTTEYTEAALIYYQQGLSDEESQARAETTLKAANVTGQTGQEVSEELTAVWNGYKVTAEETELYVDKLAAVAATTASDLEELSTGMSKVASAANAMGVDVDQLNGMLSTIISVTRQAPETAGTALKTIFARIEDLKISGEDEDGVKLGEVSSTLDEVGVHIMDVNGDIRDLGEVIEEVAGKWDTWTDAQQTAIAQAMAGKRQYNNLLALFNNWDMYSDAVETSRNSMGTLQEQQDIYMESTAAHLQQLKTEWEDFYDSLLDNGTINEVLDGLSKAVGLLNNFMDGIGGGNNALLMLGSTALRIFSKQFGEGIKNVVLHFSRLRNNAKELQAQLDNIQLFKNSSQYQNNEAVKALVDAQEQVSKYYNVLNQEQINTANALAQQVGDAKLLEQQWKKDVDALNEYQRAMQKTYGSAKFVDDNKKRSQQSTGKYDFASTDPGSKLDQAAVQNFQRSQKELENYRKSIAGLNKDYVLLAKSSKDMWKNTQDSKNKEKDIKKLRTAIKNVQDSADECLKSFTKLKDTGLLKNVDTNDLNKIELALNKISTAKGPEEYTKAMDELNLVAKKVGISVEDLLNDFQRLHEQGNKINFNAPFEKLQAFLKEAQIHQFATGIIKVIGATGQLASGINSLKNAFDVLGDSELTASEKILQFMSSAGMGITMIANSIGALSEGASKVAGAIMTVIAKKIGLITVDGELVAAETAQKIATDLGTSSIWAQVAAWIGLDAAMAPVLAIMAAILAVIAAVGVAIGAYVKHHLDAVEAIQKANEATKQRCDLIQEETKKNQELGQSLKELITQYKEGTISAEEFHSQRNKILSGLDAEARAAVNTAKSWEEATKAIDKYLAEQAKISKESHKEEAEASFENALIKGSATGLGGYDEKKHEFNGRRNISTSDYDLLKKQLELQGYNIDDILVAIKDRDTGQITGYQLQVGLEDQDTFLSFIQVIQDLETNGILGKDKAWIKDIDEFTDTEDYKNLQEEKSAEKEDAAQEAGLKSGIDVAKTLEEGQIAYENFVNTLVEQEGFTLQEANDAWVKYLSGLDTEVATQMAQTQTDIDTMTANLQKKYHGDLANSKQMKKAQDIYSQLQEMGLAEGVSLIQPEEWEELLLGNYDINYIANLVKQKLEQSFQQSFDQFKAEAGQYENDVQTIIEQAISGKVDTGEDSVYAKLKDHIQDLIKYYPELTEEAYTFNNEGLIGTQLWIDSVYDLQHAFRALELSSLTDDYSSKLQKIHNQVQYEAKHMGEQETVYDDRGFATSETIEVKADTEKFTETVEELMAADYSINIEVQADMEDDFNNLVSSMENMDSMASKIGEDFIVAAEDITEVAAAYPGILEGYTDLGNGTIQLNQEIAQSAMDAASQAEIASTEELVTEIENTNKKLQLKKNHYKTILDIATNADDAMIESGEFASKVDNELKEIEKVNSELVSQSEVDNAKTVAEDSNANAQAVSDNWNEGYSNMADASIQAAQIAIENAKAVAEANRQAANGEEVTATPSASTFQKSGWTGNDGKSTQIDTSKELQKQDEESNAEYKKRIAESAKQAMDQLDKEINANNAMAAEAAARLGKSVDTNVNVGKKKEESSKGSDSKKEAQHEDYIKREVDLYREVNEQLEQIESTLGRIQKQNSYKWGKDLQKGLERENKLLDQQLDKLKQKAEIQKGDLAQRRANLEAQGIQFSKDGSSMKNAEATLDKMYAQYNSMVDTYNAMSADQQEEYKKQLEAKKKDIDKMENDLKNYESLFGEYQSILDELQELHYKQIENAVERFNNMVDVHLELDDAKKEWNDFWYEVVQDVDDTDFGGKIAQSIGKLQTLVGLGGKASKSQIAELTDHLNDTVHEANKQMDSRNRGGEDSLFEDATKLTKENLEKYRDALMDAVREAKEEVDNIAENYLKQLESAQDLLDKQVEGWEAIGDHIEHNIELIKLVSGEKAFEPILKQYDKLYQNNLNTLNTQRQGQEFWKEQIDRYTAELKKLKDANQENTVQFKTYSEALTEATNNYRKAVADLDKTVEKALKDLQEWRKTQDDAIFDQLEKSLTQGKGLEYVEDEWNLITDISSKYLDNVERALEIEMYSNDLEKAANATGLSAKNQEKLNQFREEELKKLREKEKLTQYDIDESRARLAIMQAEMALEDQRANKSKMRLRRDSQGNYNYQYVGDEGAEEEAENGLLTAKKEWYELVKKRHDELINYEMKNIKQLQEFNQEANEALANHDMETYNLYKGLMDQLSAEMEQNSIEANKNLQDLASGTAQFFSDVANANILPTSKVTAEAITKDASGVKDAVKQAVTDMVNIQNEYDRRTTEILHTAEVNYEDLVANGIDPTTDSLESLVTSNEELAVQLDDVNTKLDEQQRLLAEAEQGYRNLRDAAVEAITDAERAIERLSQTTIDANQKVQASIAAANAAAQAAANASPGNGGGGSVDTETNGPTKTRVQIQSDPYGAANTWGYRLPGSNQYYSISGTSRQDVVNKIKKAHPDWEVYKSGGYTGNWTGSGIDGIGGRMAILHQKELVLNESDTSNLLKVITMLRDVVASINIGGLADSLVSSTAQWMNTMSAKSFSNDGISNISNVTNDTNNYKSMVVNADFSGVRSADAIYQALVELENYGMQQNYSTAPHTSKSY